MIHQVVTRVSLDSFRERSAGKKVVILYPWTSYKNLFLGHFLSDRKDGLLYFCISTGQNTLKAWLSTMVEEFDAMLGGFGDHLKQALDGGSAGDLGRALAHDLGAYSKDPLTLFIDELDRIPLDDDFNAFIDGLVTKMPSNAQIAFSSRLLTYQPWYSLIAAGEAVVLGTEYRKNDIMFTVEDQPKPQIEVYGFGRGHAVVNGEEIENWDGALPRNLFFYFIDNPLVTRDDIFATFWPNLSVKEATNVFHVTKRKISERISAKVGDGENYELTLYSSGFYMPSDKVVRHYDVDDFQDAVERATISHDPNERKILYRRAIDLYKAPFLETIDMPWVEARRHHLKQLYAQALTGMARLMQQEGKQEEALGFFIRAVKETPEREDIHREIMRLYAEMGMVEDAKKQYKALEDYLKKALKIKPSQETRDLLATL
ncbi:MAG: hypothetical protein CUN56_05135 [Phototrophicales bacterium]|nr:MAG: hypothetical protein CUN56_05135 [Phototrophicales bacterium]